MFRNPKNARQATEKDRIVKRAARQHRDDHADALPAHDLIQHLRPFLGTAALGERIEDERLVRAAGHALRHAADHAIREATPEQDEAAVARRRAEQAHLHYHADRGRHDQRFAADAVRQHAGGQDR